MDELVQQIRDLLETTVITLDDPVKAKQIVVLITTLAISMAVAGFLRWWFGRLFRGRDAEDTLEGQLLM